MKTLKLFSILLIFLILSSYSNTVYIQKIKTIHVQSHFSPSMNHELREILKTHQTACSQNKNLLELEALVLPKHQAKQEIKDYFIRIKESNETSEEKKIRELLHIAIIAYKYNLEMPFFYPEIKREFQKSDFKYNDLRIWMTELAYLAGDRDFARQLLLQKWVSYHDQVICSSQIKEYALLKFDTPFIIYCSYQNANSIYKKTIALVEAIPIIITSLNYKFSYLYIITLLLFSLLLISSKNRIFSRVFIDSKKAKSDK